MEDGKYIEFEVPNLPITDNYIMAGISVNDLSYAYTAINNAWYVKGDGTLKVYHNGSSPYVKTEYIYQSGDVLRIQGQILYSGPNPN